MKGLDNGINKLIDKTLIELGLDREIILGTKDREFKKEFFFKLKNKYPSLSFRSIGKALGIPHRTITYNYRQYEKLLKLPPKFFPN